MVCSRCGKGRKPGSMVDGVCQWCRRSKVCRVCRTCGHEFEGASRRVECDECRAKAEAMVECPGCHKERKAKTIKGGLCNHCRAKATKEAEPKAERHDYVCRRCGRTYRDVHELRQCRRCTVGDSDAVAEKAECSVCHKARRVTMMHDGVCRYCIAKPKREATTIARYGGLGFASKELTEKRYRTNIERYGDAQVSRVPEIRAKVRRTVEERWGGRFGLANPEIAARAHTTNMERYGSETPWGSEAVRETRKENMVRRYGVESSFQMQSTKDAIAYRRRARAVGDHAATILGDADMLGGLIESFDHRPTYIEIADALGIPMCQTIVKSVHRHGLAGMVNTHAKTSGMENEVRDYVRSLGFDGYADTTVLGGKELDIYVPERDVAIEFDGGYWHSDEVNPNHDMQLSKTVACEAKGIRLIHIFEWEWLGRRRVCESMIRSALGMDNRVYARRCHVVEITPHDAMTFLDANHIQGAVGSTLRLGLELDGELMSLMTFGNPRFGSFDGAEMLRYCCRMGVEVVGGMSRLMSHAIRDYGVHDVMAYCNRSKFTGRSYERIGFAHVRDTSPSYVWVNGQEVLSRYSTQMTDEDATMRSRGFRRVYDCGTKVYELHV